MPPFKRESAQEVRDRLEKWRRETGRDVKPEKPWLPINRRRTLVTSGSAATSQSVGHDVPATRPLKPLPAPAVRNAARPPLSGEIKRKSQLATATKAIEASFPDKRLKLAGKENAAAVGCKKPLGPPASLKSRREQLEEWKKSKQDLLAETKRQPQCVNRKLAIRRQTISSGVRAPFKPAGRQPLELSSSKVNLRRQTMVMSHKMSPLLRKINAKDVTLGGVAKSVPIRPSAIRPIEKPKELHRRSVLSSSKANDPPKATVATVNPPRTQPVVPPRRSISMLHRSRIAAKPLATAGVRPAVVPSKRSLMATEPKPVLRKTTLVPSRQAANENKPVELRHPRSTKPDFTVQRKRSLPSAMQPAKAMDSRKADILTPIDDTAAAKTPPIARKSVAFNLSIGSAVNTPETSPSLRSRLEYWLAARGKTTSRFRHLHCFGLELSAVKHKRMPSACTPVAGSRIKRKVVPFVGGASPQLNQPANRTVFTASHSTIEEAIEEEEEEERKDVSEIRKEVELEKLNRALNDLMELHERNYPVQGISDWLDEMYVAEPEVQNLSAYWICRSKMSERSGHPNEAVSLLNRGIIMGAQPLERLISLREKHTRYSRIAKQLDAANVFDSTKIQYVLNERPPSYCGTFKELDARSPAMVYVTPVRRSRRLSHNVNESGYAHTPLRKTPSSTNRRSVRIIDSIEQLPEEFCGRRSLYILANPALSDNSDKSSD